MLKAMTVVPLRYKSSTDEPYVDSSVELLYMANMAFSVIAHVGVSIDLDQNQMQGHRNISLQKCSGGTHLALTRDQCSTREGMTELHHNTGT
jgi:hypothetical protein